MVDSSAEGIRCFTVVGPARFTPGLALREAYIDEEVN